MQTVFTSFADIIAAWPNAAEFAADNEVSPKLVAVWKSRNSIPGAYWARTIAGAARRSIEGVTVELLSELERSRTGASQAAAD